ncbi:MAG: leucine-rich repeat domain-containing protein [Pseudomonadota bacterium]
MLKMLIVYLSLFGLTSAVNATQIDVNAFTNCAAVTDIPEVECEALVALYNSTNGDDWYNKKLWLKKNKACRWNGVECSGGHVSELSLPDNNLIGSIPSELGNLTNLKSLWLNSNSLTGSIPSELGNLTNLKSLWLGYNKLIGSIPSELGNLTDLTGLYLSDNNLTGSIPSELGNLINLKSLWLAYNELTGSIPSELGNLTDLTGLWLNSNSLTGSIPSELDNLANLIKLYLHSNQLTGSIPSELGNLTHLERLILNSNELSGSIPRELGDLTNLEYLHLDENNLCEDIPLKLKSLSNIPLPDGCWRGSCLKLDNNHLTASNSKLIIWLDSHNPGWDETQTPCLPECKLQFSDATHTTTENGGQITITVTRTVNSDGAVSVGYATSDDTAAAPDDYSQTSGTLNWDDGDDADKTFQVDIVDDGIPESDETFVVSLGNPTGGAELGEPDTTVVTITDDPAFSCDNHTGISKKECQTLVALYDSTEGAKWTDNTGWNVTNSPCDWYGVNCQGGHVTGLELGNNNLKGSISKKLNKLKKLELMLLNDNELSGKIPKSLMKLKKLIELDLNNNCLETKVSKKLKKWLNEINPGWDETQSPCP